MDVSPIGYVTISHVYSKGERRGGAYSGKAVEARAGENPRSLRALAPLLPYYPRHMSY
jgi:hypothetical protein